MYSSRSQLKPMLEARNMESSSIDSQYKNSSLVYHCIRAKSSLTSYIHLVSRNYILIGA